MRILFHIEIFLKKEREVIECVIFEKEIEMECIPPVEMELCLFDIPGYDPFETRRDSDVPLTCYINKEWRGESDRPLYQVCLESFEWNNDFIGYEWDALKKAFVLDGWEENPGLRHN